MAQPARGRTRTGRIRSRDAADEVTVLSPPEVTLLPPPAGLAQVGWPRVGPGLFLVVAAVMLVAFVLERRRRHRERRGHAKLLARDRLMPTNQPCGEPAELLAGTVATPRGDRRFGVDHGVTGPVSVTIDEQATSIECAAFEWWHEEGSSTTRGVGRSRAERYTVRRQPVVAARLPVYVPGRISLAPESVLGRTGLTRGGQQLESSEFNRRFRVESRDRTLTVQLLAPQLQQRLLEEFDGRRIHLAGTLVVLGGQPSHRDGSLPGVIGALPAVRQDLQRLLAAVPARFWRAVAAQHGSG